MRVVLGIGGPLPVLVYREKLAATMKMLEVLRSHSILSDLSLDWIVFRGIPRSAISRATGYVVMIREELVLRKRLANLELREATSEAIKKLSRLWGSQEPEKRPLMRDSEIIMGFKAKFLDYPITGTIHVRGSGWMRRMYGDVEITAYYAPEKIEGMADLYIYVARMHGDEIAKKFEGAATAIIHQIKQPIKSIYLQPLDTDVVKDYDQLVAVAHKDPRTHLALIMRFMRKKRKDVIRQKLVRGQKDDAEVIVSKKLSTYLNYSTLYNKVASKPEFIGATIKTYTATGMLATSGSLIIASRTGEFLGKAYKNYIENVLLPFASNFPEIEQFDKWVENGLRRLRELAGFP